MHPLFNTLFCLGLVGAALFSPQASWAQKKTRQTPVVTTPKYQSPVPDTVLSLLQWRDIGPYRAGRSCAVTGVPGQPDLFYMGATGGGVWKTNDAGQTWKNISDGYFGGSIGSIAVSEWDRNVIYVGGGEKTVRGNMSQGHGMWKSLDAGKSWTSVGLTNSRHIPRVRIHPKNPDLVYAAVLGDVFKPGGERGVYRSKDGGKTWERTLFVNDEAGAVDLLLDPNNPRIIYATTWKVKRTPYSMESGGEGSAMWKSTDGGDSWVDISKKKGLPKGTWGIVGVAVSPVNSDRVWALIENEKGGLFRSDDGGEHWMLVNSDRSLRQRAWYYTRIYAHPTDVDMVYALNVQFHVSNNGGVSFKTIDTPHGDHHDLWLNPLHPERMIVGDDGGAQVTVNRGETWSDYHNQGTAQFYRVTTDNSFPYRIYVAQQDNSTLRVKHRSTGGSISREDWEETAGGESAHIAVDPTDDDIVYGGSYGGFLTRLNHRTGQNHAINVWPDNPIGHGAGSMKYRFQWNFPIFFSPHDPGKLYAASNHLHVSTDKGHSWKTISPDLTRNDSTKLGASGGPITKDNTGVEYYCTVFAATESPYEKDLLWAGSDDGLLHISRDGGSNWTNVTPANMPDWMMINSIDADPFVKGGAYVAGTRYKMGDYKPYIYYTGDYGKTWRLLVSGIPDEHFTRVVRADPNQKGVLYAGTERGMYISYDNGEHWQSFQRNLPIVPVTDLAIKNKNLIATTQGRGIWIVDDLHLLHQAVSTNIIPTAITLFKPSDSYRMPGYQAKDPVGAGTNHLGGVPVHFFMGSSLPDSAEVKLIFQEADGDTIRVFSTKAKEKGEKLEVKPGPNTFVWNMRYPDATSFDGMVLWWSSMSGPKAVPGNYQVTLVSNSQKQTHAFQILADPRNESTAADLQQQFDFLKSVCDKVSEAHKAIIEIREIKEKMKNLTPKNQNPNMKPLSDTLAALEEELTRIEETLYQTKNRSGQDPLNFPIRLTNKLAHVNSLVSMSDFAPTAQSIAVRDELSAQIDVQLRALEAIKKERIPGVNALVRSLQIDAIRLNGTDK